MSPDRLREILGRFSRGRILVLGDVMLDVFVWGTVSRISPEAPVPVVEVTRESFYPGGAANVARSLDALGARVCVAGTIGADPEGRRLQQILRRGRVDTKGLIVDPTRPTTVKTRVVAQHQQVVRFDREQAADIAPALQHKLLACYKRALARVDAVIFEDYAKGVLSQKLLDRMLALARRAGKITAADPNPRRLLNYHSLTAITPNRAEAFAAAGVAHSEPHPDVLADKPLLRVGRILLKRWQPQNLLVTLGEHGMCLFQAGARPHHIPTVAQEVFDVSGAGDTAIATLVLALTAGATAVEAAEIANHGAGVVVGKIGTATCSIAELRQSFARHAE